MRKAHLLANYSGALFIAGSQLLAIPLYMRALGVDGWGRFSAILALSTLLLTLEAGVSLAAARSFALAGTSGRSRAANLAALERRYFWAAAGVLGFGSIGAPWLGPVLLPAGVASATGVFVLASIMSASQLVGSLFRGALVGVGAQVRLNGLLIAFAAARHALALLVAFQGAGLVAVTAVHAASHLLEAAARRWVAIAAVGRSEGGESPDAPPPAPVAFGGTRLAIAGAVGAASTQLDRIVLGHLVDAASLGAYAAAASLSMAALQFAYPITNALMPALHRFQDPAHVRATTGRTWRLLLAVIGLIWVGAIAVASGGLDVWLHDAGLATTVRPLFLVHLFGTTLNIACIPAYMRLLATHHDRGILLAPLLSVPVQLFCLVALSRWGAMAGAVAWCAFNVTNGLAYSLALKSGPLRHDVSRPT